MLKNVPTVDISYVSEPMDEPTIPESVGCQMISSQAVLQIPVSACLSRSRENGMCYRKNCETGAEVRRERGLPVYTYAPPQKPEPQVIEQKPPRRKKTEEEKREAARKRKELSRMRAKMAALKKQMAEMRKSL